MLADCDGMILTTSEVFEPDAVAELQEWYAETDRPVFTICPYTSRIGDDIPDAAKLKAEEAKSQAFVDFLDAAVKKHGKASLIYVSASAKLVIGFEVLITVM